MNKVNINMLDVGIIFFLLISIVFMIKLIVENRENFNSNSNLDALIDKNMQQLSERQREEEILKKADRSVSLSRDMQGKLRFENADSGGTLMDKYVQDLIISDVGNPNKTLIDDKSGQLPSVVEDNLPQYNHEMKKLLNSKMIKQKYSMTVLKNKINELKNALMNIEDIKDEFEMLLDNNIDSPEKQKVLAILKKTAD